jgi:hypothetical protein
MKKILIAAVIVLVLFTGVAVVLSLRAPQPVPAAPVQNVNSPVVTGQPINAETAPIEVAPGEAVDTNDYLNESLQELEIVDAL